MIRWLRSKWCFHKWIASPWRDTIGAWMCERCGVTYFPSGTYMGMYSSFPRPNSESPTNDR